MLGLFDDIFLEEASIELRPGNSLLFYTDGVTEARSSTGEFFGVERLSQSICEAGHLPAPELCDFILERVDQFQPPSEQYDDIALLVMSLNQGG
jgi:sigma-B regulation protein RsbU (phosphoserine phosphatase)